MISPSVNILNISRCNIIPARNMLILCLMALGGFLNSAHGDFSALYSSLISGTGMQPRDITSTVGNSQITRQKFNSEGSIGGVQLANQYSTYKTSTFENDQIIDGYYSQYGPASGSLKTPSPKNYSSQTSYSIHLSPIATVRVKPETEKWLNQIYNTGKSTQTNDYNRIENDSREQTTNQEEMEHQNFKDPRPGSYNWKSYAMHILQNSDSQKPLNYHSQQLPQEYEQHYFIDSQRSHKVENNRYETKFINSNHQTQQNSNDYPHHTINTENHIPPANRYSNAIQILNAQRDSNLRQPAVENTSNKHSEWRTFVIHLITNPNSTRPHRIRAYVEVPIVSYKPATEYGLPPTPQIEK